MSGDNEIKYVYVCALKLTWLSIDIYFNSVTDHAVCQITKWSFTLSTQYMYRYMFFLN